MSAEPVAFLATIRPIQSALSVSGNNDGARLTLDIPETELPAIARLLLMRGIVLRVTVEEVRESLTNGSPKANSRTARKPTDLASS